MSAKAGGREGQVKAGEREAQLTSYNPPASGDIHQLTVAHYPAGRSGAARERKRLLRSALQRSC